MLWQIAAAYPSGCSLEQTPIPGYQHDPTRRYGFNFSGLDIRFRIQDRILTVVEIVPL